MASQPQRVQAQSQGMGMPSVSDPSCSELVRIAALSIECIARPEDAKTAHTAIPIAIHAAFGIDPAFAGCLVLASDRESRLMSVVTFWNAKDHQNARRLYDLLLSHVDHCLRIRTVDAYLGALPGFANSSRESMPGLPAEAEASEVSVFAT